MLNKQEPWSGLGDVRYFDEGIFSSNNFPGEFSEVAAYQMCNFPSHRAWSLAFSSHNAQPLQYLIPNAACRASEGLP